MSAARWDRVGLDEMKIELINIELSDYLFIGRPLTLWPLKCGVSRFAVIAIIALMMVTMMMMAIVVVDCRCRQCRGRRCYYILVLFVDFRCTFSLVCSSYPRESIAKCHFDKSGVCISVTHFISCHCCVFPLLFLWVFLSCTLTASHFSPQNLLSFVS